MLADPQAVVGLRGFGAQHKTQQEEALQDSSGPENTYLP